MMIRIEITSDAGVSETTLEEFLLANDALDAADVSVLAGLRVGDEHVLGGGAAPAFTVRRVA
jgi:hypothetical protein